MPRQRMSVREERQTARALEKSLQSTADGLALMAQSLERGGFKQAVAPYQQMQQILLQQRLWSVDYKRRELEPHWKAIAAQAAAIHAFLAPFTAVMDALKDLDRITSVEAAAAREAGPAVESQPAAESQPEPDPLLAQIAALLVEDATISGVRLARALDCPADDRRARLRALAATGRLEPGGWGRGRRYRLSAEARARLAAALAGQLAAAEAGSNPDGL